MDAFTGIKYNISKQNLTKYGFERVEKLETTSFIKIATLFLAMLAEPSINKIQQPANDNLTSQKNLINGLANIEQNYF